MKNLFILITILLSTNLGLFSQKVNDYFEESKDNYYYYFKIQAEFYNNYIENQGTYEMIRIKNISEGIDSCQLKHFKKNQRKTLKKGLILIGPFETKNKAGRRGHELFSEDVYGCNSSW